MFHQLAKPSLERKGGEEGGGEWRGEGGWGGDEEGALARTIELLIQTTLT